MLCNLIAALEAKKISTLAVSQLLGVTEKTAYNKIYGNTDFTLPEALKLKVNLLPEYDLYYLFTPTAEAATA